MKNGYLEEFGEHFVRAALLVLVRVADAERVGGGAKGSQTRPVEGVAVVQVLALGKFTLDFELTYKSCGKSYIYIRLWQN